jgi:hypothetical protein
MIGRSMVVVVFAAIAAGLVAPPVAGALPARPELEVADPGSGCPGIAGAFVALLDQQRGALLLSGAPFPGGLPAGDAAGAGLTVATPRGQWAVARAGIEGAAQRVWAAAYALPGLAATGCVAFDRHSFSSEGDLASYLRWLVGDVYLQLPADQRQAFPAFRLSDREVRLAIAQGDKPAIELSGREGSTLAFRVTGETRTFLVSPFVLERSLPVVALRLAVTDQPFWQAAPKQALGWQMASPDQPGILDTPRVTIRVLGLAAPEAPVAP